MTEQVWKYELAQLGPPQVSIPMPAGAKLLTAREQHGSVCIWARVDPSEPPEPRLFRTYMTGQPLDDLELEYVGTCLFDRGFFVLHVFEEKPK